MVMRRGAPGRGAGFGARRARVASRSGAARLDGRRAVSSSSAISGSSGVLRIEVEHEPVAELGNRRQREELRRHLGAQVDDHAQRRPGGLPPEADAGDVRDRWLHARRQLRELRVEVDAVEVEDDAVRVLERSSWCGERRWRLEDQPRVLLRRPDPRRGDRCRRSPTPPGSEQPGAGEQHQAQRAAALELTPSTPRSGAGGDARDHRDQASLTRRRVRA